MSDRAWVWECDRLRVERDEAQAELAALRAQRCGWTYDDTDDKWDTGCGHAYQFNDGGPRENAQTFCGYCGARIEIAPEATA